ncbi:FecR domain-containing protein [Opitutia bacterium ISCC 51]|nr:FecR domain-containing protein [Opitutae bacterium ISCC 51]QXD30115.1 FecR domain-containing protein [Opitutae bacterium ISCC 52]
MNQDEQLQLIDELLDGSITEADFLRIEAEMRVNADTRQLYYDRLKLHSALVDESERLGSQNEVVKVSFWRQHSQWLGAVAAIILLVAVAYTSWQFGQKESVTEVAVSEPIARGFAILADYSDANWSGEENWQRGDLIPEGPMKLQSGIAQLEFFSGVMVLVEGETEFEVLSPMEMTVSKGRVRALVPEAAKGFKVSTSSGKVIDLGTEFALEVNDDQAEMHVLQGEIEWHTNSKEVHTLTDGQSMRWDDSGGSNQVEISPSRYPDMEDFDQHFLHQKQIREQAWREKSDHIAQDLRSLAFYPVNSSNASGRMLTDDAQSGLNGTVVRARRVSDRWGQAGSALNFSPAGSRVRVSIPGEHNSLTFYCWARIDSLDRWYNSLFLTDGHELNEPHWQIMNDGRLFFSVKRRERDEVFEDKHIAYSPSFWDPSKSGQWFQIATVYDIENWTTTHYVNGVAISQDHIDEEYRVDTVKIGAASIGNWNEPTRDDSYFALRNLNGAIDEFAIFTQALSAQEIAELYEKGRP